MPSSAATAQTTPPKNPQDWSADLISSSDECQPGLTIRQGEADAESTDQPLALKTSLTGIPRTLLLTLRARAEEQQHPSPLLLDPLASRWMHQVGWDSALDCWYGQAMQVGICLRCGFFDEATRAFVSQRKPQSRVLVVEVGAGLSTRRARVLPTQQQSPPIRWVSFDLPEVMALRGQLERPCCQSLHLSGSVLLPDWADHLPEADPKDTLLIAEGLLMYLTPQEVGQVIQHWRQRFPGATLLLDVFNWFAAWINGRPARRIGAPLQWTVDRLDQLAALGLSPLNEWRMFAARPDRWGWLAPFRHVPAFQKTDRVVTCLIEPW